MASLAPAPLAPAPVKPSQARVFTPAKNGVQPENWRPWYDDIIDWLISHPGGTAKECAAALRHTPEWVRLVIKSDIFQARYAERRAALTKSLDEGISAKLQQVAFKSLDLLADRLDRVGKVTSISELREVAATALHRLGYGVESTPAIDSPAPSGPVSVSISVIQEGRSRIEASEQARLISPTVPAERPAPMVEEADEVVG